MFFFLCLGSIFIKYREVPKVPVEVGEEWWGEMEEILSKH